MLFNFAGKTALITGSSKGIGFSIAQALHAEGCKVALNSRNLEQLAKATEQLSGSIGLMGDVTQAVDAQRIVSEVIKSFGKLDILVCNVGGGKSVPPGEETLEEWQRIFALNLWSTINTVTAAYDPLVESKGVIICISSICGLETIAGAPITYSAAKAALHSYVRGIARPLGNRGVRINAIAPGNILFDGSVWSHKLSENAPAVQSMLEREVSLGCLGQPQDIANLVVFLSSANASFASGAIWTLDGGQVHS
jgi:3-oxoacyl-[acyl-carrier protein] reductase